MSRPAIVRRLGWHALLSAASVGLLATTTGCHQTAGLSQQEIVVVFAPDASQADHARVWQACHALPGVVAEPLVTTSKYSSSLRNNVRYRVDHASNYQLQQLYNCLRQDRAVSGYTSDGADQQ